MKRSNAKSTGVRASKAVADGSALPAAPVSPDVLLRVKVARNKANTIRNSAKAERYLMEVEKMHGFARSWALRERLEQGHVSLDELMRR